MTRLSGPGKKSKNKQQKWKRVASAAKKTVTPRRLSVAR